MAHLGLLLRGTLVFSLFAIGCGAKVGDEGASTSDTGTSEDAPDEDVPLKPGFTSWTATVTTAKVTWMYGGPYDGGGSAPSIGKSFRLDVDAVSKVAVAMTPFQTAYLLRGIGGPMKADKGAPFFGASGTASYSYQTDSYDTLEITLDSAGRPIAGVARGKASSFSGDVGWEGTVEATLSFAPDTVKPTFRASATTSFASVPLPWDERTIQASEPYEESYSPIAFPSSMGPVDSVDIVEQGWLAPKMRGTRVHYRSWDGVAGAKLVPKMVHDAAGNAAITDVMKFDGAIDVPRFSGTSLRFGAATVATWGSAKVVTTGCKSSKSCLAIGPFEWSYCAHGSPGGAAVRFPGVGLLSANVRAHAVPAPKYPGYPGESPPPFGLAQLGAVVPGGNVELAESSTMKWPTTPAADGSWDTGWTMLTTMPKGSGSEMGAMVGAGQAGAYSSDCSMTGGPPIPLAYDVTLYVDDLSIAYAD